MGNSKKFKRESAYFKGSVDIMPKNIWLNIHSKKGMNVWEPQRRSRDRRQAEPTKKLLFAVGNEAAKGVRQVKNSLMILAIWIV